MKCCPFCSATYPDYATHCPNDGFALADTDIWSEGTIIREKYRIVGLIGRGGMGEVYKALHMHFDELRALKVINRELASDENFAARFLLEAKLTRRLQHPNAVRTDDFDRAEDGRPFMVMEYIDGRTLKDEISRRAPMDPLSVCEIAKQVCGALEGAHSLGMVHRDIKPDNIFLANKSDGYCVKVLDFGIAHLKEVDDPKSSKKAVALTRTGMLVGTPAYMSPEQALGKRGRDLDGRSDLFSLGVALYQMLTNELPFTGDSEMAVLMAHISAAPVPVGDRGPHVPYRLASLVMQCLEKTPEMRPPSAGSMVDLIAVIESELNPGTTAVLAVGSFNSKGENAGATSLKTGYKKLVVAAGVLAAVGIIYMFAVNSLGKRSVPLQRIENTQYHSAIAPKSDPATQTVATPFQGQHQEATLDKTQPTANMTTSIDDRKTASSRRPSPSPPAAMSQRVPSTQPTLAYAEDSVDVQAALAEGDIYENRLDFERALAIYKEALTSYPGNQSLRSRVERLAANQAK